MAFVDGKYRLGPCPFCHSDAALQLKNTHTPSFWIACDQDLGGCGAEHHGGRAYEKRTGSAKKRNHYDPMADVRDPWSSPTLAQMPKNYQRAALSAIDKWNDRSEARYFAQPTRYLKEFDA